MRGLFSSSSSHEHPQIPQRRRSVHFEKPKDTGMDGSPEEHGIECVNDLPAVGANLKDHHSFPVMMELPFHDTLHILMSTLLAIKHFLLYIFFGLGIMGRPTTLATIFVRTSALDEKAMTVRAEDAGDKGEMDNMDASQPRNIPNVEIMLQAINCVETGIYLTDNALFTVYTTLVQPFSTGRLELISTDPSADFGTAVA